MVENGNGDKRNTYVNIALVVAVLALLGGVAWAYFSQYDSFNRQNLDAFVRQFGPWAVLVYAIVYIAASPVPFVAPVLSATSGLLFGLVRGTVYILFIATASAFVPYTLARRLGQQWLEDKLKGRSLEKWYQKSSEQGGFLFVFLMRLIPVLPWEIQNYVAGMTKVAPLTFALATIAGIVPGTSALVFLGASATEPGSWQFYVAVGLNIVMGVLPAVVVGIRQLLKRRRRDDKAPK